MIDERGRFVKGSEPSNKMPVGSVTVRRHKFDGPRKWIKVAEPNTWIPNAVYVWTYIGGTVPKGFIVHHLNEDTLDDTPSNLGLVSRAHHINIHRDKLLLNKPKHLTLRRVVCVKCGNDYQGKKKGAMCDSCSRANRKEARRRYKKRIRVERQRARAASTP